MSEALLKAARTVLGSACLAAGIEKGEAEILVPPSRIVEVLQLLRDNDTTAMNQLMDICGVDYPDHKKRFEVVYNLLSLKKNGRLRVCVQAEKDHSVPSVTGVFPSAGWFEREVFDLFGIVFDGHPDLRRILTDYGFEGHPLRRDFPLMGFTQVRYDDLQQKVVSEPVKLEEQYRPFDALSPWQGMTEVQKRGAND